MITPNGNLEKCGDFCFLSDVYFNFELLSRTKQTVDRLDLSLYVVTGFWPA